MAGELPVIDRSKLARRTMASDMIEVEMLALFETECERLLAQVHGAEEPKLRSERLNAVWAAARNVGAARLAAVALELAGRSDLQADELGRLDQAVEEVRSAVRRDL